MAATYLYDPRGRRVKKSGTGITTASYLLDGDNEIAEYDGTGALTLRYVPGAAIDDVIAQGRGVNPSIFLELYLSKSLASLYRYPK